MTKQALLLLIALAVCSHAAETKPPQEEELFKRADQLARMKNYGEALAAYEEGIALAEKSLAAGAKPERRLFESYHRAAEIARRDFLDYEKAMRLARRSVALSDSDYWRVPSLLQVASTYRAMGDFQDAQQVYDTIAATEERYACRMLIPQAHMVLYDMGDIERGNSLLKRALLNEGVHYRERGNALMQHAQRALEEGRRQEAIEWYAFMESLPMPNEKERALWLSRAWYEMGRIREQGGQTVEAKELYRKVIAMEDGEMRYRADARRALEGIEYFE